MILSSVFSNQAAHEISILDTLSHTRTSQKIVLSPAVSRYSDPEYWILVELLVASMMTIESCTSLMSVISSECGATWRLAPESRMTGLEVSSDSVKLFK